MDEIHHGHAVMAGDEAKHLRQVLRAEIGQRYELSDGKRVYLAEIESFRKGETTFRVIEEIPQVPLLLEITLFAALIKFDRFEWTIEKATELGVSQIVPVVAARCDAGLDKAAPKRLERWNRIALESAKQSHRVGAPQIAEPVKLEQAASDAIGIRLFLDEYETKPLLATLPALSMRNQGDSVSLLIGPEGGWIEAERSYLKASGFEAASMGLLILRAETAAVAALGVIQSAWQSAVTGAGAS